jgi:uncharacterized cupin superfamily protein
MPNINEPDFDEPREHPGFRASRGRVSRQAGARQLGLSLWAVPPGEAAYPYHWHHGQEELLIVLRGRPTLRTPEGTRELDEGEVLVFHTGEQGAHQLLNGTDQEIRFLAFSHVGAPDVVIYPDSNKLGAFENRPEGGGLRALYPRDSDVDYYEGETPPEL